MNEMIAAHDEKTYPPRFRYVLSGGEQNEMVKFVFKGLKESRQYEVTLTSTVAGMCSRVFATLLHEFRMFCTM